MATVAGSDPGLTGSFSNVKQRAWVALGTDDTGTGEILADYPDKTITVTGTWGGATLIVQGSNDGVTYITMTDPQGNALSKTANFIETILENPLYIKVVTSGGTGTVLSAIITMVKK